MTRKYRYFSRSVERRRRKLHLQICSEGRVDVVRIGQSHARIREREIE